MVKDYFVMARPEGKDEFYSFVRYSGLKRLKCAVEVMDHTPNKYAMTEDEALAAAKLLTMKGYEARLLRMAGGDDRIDLDRIIAEEFGIREKGPLSDDDLKRIEGLLGIAIE